MTQADTRRTDEHFFGALVGATGGASASAARRLADLTSQVDFLDREVTRYRELLETERIRHAKAIADVMLASDARADEMRRDDRYQTEAVHAAYRKLLAQRQAESDATLSRLVQVHAAALQQERQRHEHLLAHERERREAEVAATKTRARDELAAAHGQSHHALMVQAGAAKEAATRNQDALLQLQRKLRASQALLKASRSQVDDLERQLEAAMARYRSRVDELETRATTAEERLTAERQRSAATLSEVLTRSASVAAEADQARVTHAAQQARLEQLLAATHQQAQEDLEALAAAADERSRRSADREALLEGQIVQLRSGRTT